MTYVTAGNRLASVQKWGYATIPLIIRSTEAILDTQGDDGRELVAVIPDLGEQNLVAYLKQPEG